jgi:hypothetical protein
MIRYFRIICLQIIVTGLFCNSAWGDVDIPPTEDGEPMIVYMAFGIINIYDINDSRQNLSLNLVGKIRWNDPRLTHDGPGIIKRKIDKIWYPVLIVPSMQHSSLSIPRFVEIYPNGDVVYRVNTSVIYSSPMDLRNYPFDRQIFKFPIVANYNIEELVLLPDPESPSYLGEELTVADWDIKNFGIASSEESLNRYKVTSKFEVYFEAVRRSEFIILTFIIPLMLIVAMSWVVFWIDPLEIRSQFSVSVTTVLTLIAYDISLGYRLPEIPYLTRMDIFIFGSTIIVFASLLEVVVTSHLAGTGRASRGRQIDVKCRWLFPIAFVFLIVFAFFLGLKT